MTQRDEGHDYRDSKNKAQAYERNKKIDAQANDLINIFFEFLCDSDLEKFGTHTERGKFTVTDWLKAYSNHPFDHGAQLERAIKGLA